MHPDHPFARWLNPHTCHQADRLTTAMPVPQELPEVGRVLQISERCFQFLSTVELPDDVLDIVTDIGQAWSTMRASIPTPPPPTTSDLSARSLCHGYLEYAPLYCMLLYFSLAQLTPTDANKLLQLHAYILLAYLLLAPQAERAQHFTSAGGQSCRFARQLLEDEYASVRQQLPDSPLSLDDYCEAIHTLEHNTTGLQQSKLHHLGVLLDFVRSGREFKRSYHRAAAAPMHPRPQRIASDPDTDEGGAGFEWIDLQTWRHPDHSPPQHLLTSGLAPFETVSPRITLRSLGPISDESSGLRGDFTALVRRQRGLLTALSRRNQRLPIAYEALREDEVHCFLGDLIRDIQHLLATPNDAPLAGDSALMLMLVVLTGGLPAERYGMQIIDYAQVLISEGSPNLPDTASWHFLYQKGQGLWLALAMPPPALKIHRYKEIQPLLHPTISWLWLTLPETAHRIVVKLLRNQYDARHSRRIFHRSLDDLLANAQSWMKRCNHQHHTTLTMTRISQILPQRLAAQAQDWGVASLLTGISSVQEYVPLHYHTVSTTTLRTLYQQVISALFKQFTDPIAATSPAKAPPQDAVVGSPLQPKPQVLTQVIGELQAPLTLALTSIRPRAPLTDWLTLHRHYTLYTVQFALYATGIRAVYDPLQSVHDIDWHTGECFIADKEIRSSENARVVYLAPVLLDHLTHYRRYLKALAVRLQPLNPVLAQTIRSAENGMDRTVPFLFFLSNALHLVPISPHALKERMAGHYPTAENANRHYLRSQLSARGCPGEWLEALLGHDSVGLEPFGSFSAASFAQLRQLTHQYIEPLLRADGWKAYHWTPYG